MGTARRKDITGQVFGKLTVIGFSHVTENGQAKWDVSCECGGSNKVTYGNLIYGNTLTCGCSRKEGRNKKAVGVSSFNNRYGSYKQAAKVRNLIFDLSKDQFKEIVTQPCHYCGSEEFMPFTAQNCNGHFYGHGVDRIDSSKGYFIENCLPCCRRCNTMKLDMPYDVFINHMKKILNHLGV